jgi:hypothetical protein
MDRLKQVFPVGPCVIGGFRSGHGKNAILKAFITALAISFCGLVEAGTLEPRNTPPKALDGGQVLHSEDVDNLGAGDITFLEVKNGIGKSNAKLSMGGGEANLIPITPSEIRTDTRKNEKTDERRDSQLFILVGFVIVVLIPLLAFPFQHNEKLSRSGPAGRDRL